MYSSNAIIEATVLVDGMVAGTWALRRDGTAALVKVTPFGRLSRSDRASLMHEGERLARFLVPDAKTHGSRV